MAFWIPLAVRLRAVPHIIKITAMPQYTKTVSAGSRIYYFDVRTDRKGQRYITISEMSKATGLRSTIFLHAEDYDKFAGALAEATEAAQANENKS